MIEKKIKINKLDYINPEEVLIRFQDKKNLIFLDSANKTISKNKINNTQIKKYYHKKKYHITKDYIKYKKPSSA